MMRELLITIILSLCTICQCVCMRKRATYIESNLIVEIHVVVIDE